MQPGIYRNNTLIKSWQYLEEKGFEIEKDYSAFKDSRSVDSNIHNLLKPFGDDLTLVLPDVKIIGMYAFQHCDNITNIILPDTITRIKRGAFKQSSIKNITFSKNLECIESLAFGFCNNLEEVIIPENVIEIMDATFVCCNKLTNIILPNTLSRIHASAFEKCRNLTYIKIPNGVTDIYSSAFIDCEKLEEVVFNKGLERIWTSAFKNTNIKKLDFPKSLIKIEGFAFEDCKNLKNINFKNIEEMGHHVFSGCDNLETVVFPKNEISYIGKEIFENCPKLRTIYVSETFDIENPWFANEYKNLLVVQSLDSLIETGKSFKEINDILKKDESLYI